MIWEHSAGIIPFRMEHGKRKYLLLLSALTKSKVWEFPKGLIETGEEAQTAALREFHEETGISEAEIVPGFKKVVKYFYRREGNLVGKTVAYYLGRVRSSRVKISQESKDSAWVTLQEAGKRIKHKNILELVAEADHFLSAKINRQDAKDF